MGGPTRSADEIREALEQLRARPVVPLRRFRVLREQLGRTLCEELIRDLQAMLRQCAEQMYHLYGDALVAWIERIAKKYRVPGHRSPEWLAAWVSEHPYFWRQSQKARQWYAQYNEVPVAEVKAHVREGRPVRGHRRLLGFEHLTNLAPDGGVVDEVLRLIVSGAVRPVPPRRPRQATPAGSSTRRGVT